MRFYPPLRPFRLPGQRCLPGAGSAHATGIRRPLQPPVVVDSNPTTLIKKKPRTLTGAGLFLQGSFKGGELTGNLPSFFAGPKTETLIYQCFYFAKTAKNAIFGSLLLRSAHNSDKWRFNAWLVSFILLKRQESSSQASPLFLFLRAWIPQSSQP